MSGNSKLSSFFGAFDVYTARFFFNVQGHSRGYRTFIGGFFSLIILIIVIAYSVYTLSKWITGGFQISTSYLTSFQRFSYTSNFSPIQFGVLLNWNTVPNISSYITFRLQNVQTQKNQTTNYTRLNTTKCQNIIPQDDTGWINYQYSYHNFECIDYTNNTIKGQPLTLENEGKSYVQLDVFRCNQNDPAVIAANITCANASEIDDFLLTSSMRLVVSFIDVDYNTLTQRPVYSIQERYLNPQLKTVSWASASASCVNLSIKNDTILSKEIQEPYLQDTTFAIESFQRDEYLRKFKDFDEYKNYTDQLSDHMLRLEYRLSNKVKKTAIAFPRLDTVLASLFAFTKVIFAFGIIFSVLNAVYMKDKMLRTICSNYYQQKNGFELKISGFKRAFHYATNGRYLKKNSQKGAKQSQNDDLQQQKLYKKWIELSDRFTNINNLYKELMLLRNAVQMLYTEEQWAALVFTGRRLEALKSTVLGIKSRSPSLIESNTANTNSNEGLYEQTNEKLRQIVREKVQEQFDLNQYQSSNSKKKKIKEDDGNGLSYSNQSINSIDESLIQEEGSDIFELKAQKIKNAPNHLERIELLSIDKEYHADKLEQFLSKNMTIKTKQSQQDDLIIGQKDKGSKSFENRLSDRILESIIKDLVLDDQQWDEQARERIKQLGKIN